MMKKVKFNYMRITWAWAVLLLLACIMVDNTGDYPSTLLQVSELEDIKSPNVASDGSAWVWMGGNKSINQYGVYGEKGEESPSNYPGARQGTTSWVDAQGNMWLFGGDGWNADSNSWLNDLWRYNITSHQWAWMSGNKTGWINGLYGTKGVASPLNCPGVRHGMTSWIDTSGHFWVFGGSGMGSSTTGSLNDLWHFNTTSFEWTWVAGSDNSNSYGFYGSKTVFHADNIPGARLSMTTWTDMNGLLWLFGGYGRSQSDSGWLNDLWCFNTTSNMWAWMAGDLNPANSPTSAGKGIFAVANTPGSRSGMNSWIDNQNQLWIFGGHGYASDGIGYLNDFWCFNTTLNMWAWMGGNLTMNPVGSYGTLGSPSSSFYPGGRQFMTVWQDLEGLIWLWGGKGYGASSSGFLNDLWRYDMSLQEWTWIGGNQTVDESGEYGTCGISSPSNLPGARWNMASWVDKEGQLWLFGGEGMDESTPTSGDLNDLWRFSIPPGEFLLTSNADAPDTDGTFTLSWSPAIGAASYSIFRYAGLITGLNGSLIEIIANIDVQTHIISGLPSGTYCFVIVANNSGGYTLSNNIQITIAIPPGPFVLTSNAASPDGDGGFQLSWSASTEALNYTVYMHSNFITEINETVQEIASEITVLSHTITGLGNGTYYFVVVAANPIGDTFSNNVMIQVEITSEIDEENDNKPKEEGEPSPWLWILLPIAITLGIAIYSKSRKKGTVNPIQISVS
jgi:hypothetical protein